MISIEGAAMVAACDYVEEGAQGGEAGADDRDAIFDHGPNCGVHIDPYNFVSGAPGSHLS